MATGYKDYYKILGVDRSATPKEIKAAFRKLARKHHPDVNPGDPGAEARFKEANEANEVLGDPQKRKLYDQYGAGWEHAGAPGGPFPGGGGGRQVEYRTTTPADLEQLFGSASPFSDFFHDMFGGRPGPSSRPAARRGADVEGEVTITLEEAAAGTLRTVEVGGPGTSRRVQVKIPAGIADGGRVRAAGQGGGGDGGGASGDLFIRVRVKPHPTFTRQGDDLRARVDVPLEVAVLGGGVEVPTVRGTRVSLTVPPETQNGSVLRLRGLGMPRLRTKGSGDLHAEVNVRIPLPVPPALKAWAETAKSAAAAKV